MADSTTNSDLIIREASRSLANQQAGGRRRSIGKASARMKARHLGRKLRNVFLAVVGIYIAAGVVGWIANGIGILGFLAFTAGAVLLAGFLLKYPKLKVPDRSDLQSDDVRKMVERTELWLEAQRPALPPPAAKLVNQLGVQLDELGLQLEEVDQQHPTALEIRKLVGEHLPDMIEGYQRIPEKMRYEERAGSTPNAQLMAGLRSISNEIDSVTRQLAQGSLDDLAIRTRYLDYKYGGEDFDSEKGPSA